MDFKDQLFVWMEAKFKEEPLGGGQRLAFQRTCDAVAETGRESIVLVLSHDRPPEEDIPFASLLVREFRYDGRWHVPQKPITCREAIDAMLQKAGIML